jgi:hypothetical protein
MRIGVIAFLMMTVSMPALAQTSPGFIDGSTLCANLPNDACARDSNPNPLSLNQAFMGKADFPITSSALTITGTPTPGYVPIATGTDTAAWGPLVPGPQGPLGPQGPAGPQGVQGPPGSSTASPLQVTTGSTSIVDLQTVEPTNGFYASGSGAVFQSTFATLTQLNSVFVKTVAASASVPEGGQLIKLQSNIGAASGLVGAYKIGQAIEITANPGSSSVYGHNIVMNLASGFGNFMGNGMEIDINNNNADYPFTGLGGVAISYGMQILAGAGPPAYPITAALAIGSISSSYYGFHAGIYFSTHFGAMN